MPNEMKQLLQLAAAALYDDGVVTAMTRSREPILAKAVIAQAAEIVALRGCLDELDMYADFERLDDHDRKRMRAILAKCVEPRAPGDGMCACGLPLDPVHAHGVG